MVMMTSAQEINDLKIIIQSSIPLIVIESTEELRVKNLLSELATVLNKPLYGWTVTEGLRRIDVEKNFTPIKSSTDPFVALNSIKNTERPSIFVLFDFHHYLEDSFKNQRLLKEIAIHNTHHKNGSCIVLVGHQLDISADLRRHAARFELSMPGREQLEKLVREEAVSWSKKNSGKRVTTENKTLSRLVDNLRGLTFGDARRLIRKVIWNDGAITDEELPAVNKAKFELLDMDGVLSFEYDTAQFSEVGGLRKLKAWVEKREKAFFQDETAQQLEPPKGMMLVGVQGGGKSLASKAVAGIWGVPLLRLDFGSLYNKYHGETEKNLRQALKMAELMSPCVLWMDEIEKGIATNDNDGGTSRRVLGTLLTWMSEQNSGVFVVATANDISGLPPELIRKGRLDEIFFVDLPSASVRKDIFEIHMKKRALNPNNYQLDPLAELTEGFSGAEIEQAVVSSLYHAVADEKVPEQQMLVAEINNTRPLSIVMAEDLEELRQWAKNRTVFAD
jgi:SpoVK/Ycf46/Vps4 family AAA+-type ATPase